ncbi:hypothetical protein HMPREF0307_00956 [Corynebacterium sp. DNF00584]|nr:hypothetical protein HMPREF0307_00956 [Corynebacterium sp. DNF00584]
MTISLFAALSIGVSSLPEAAGTSLTDILTRGVSRPDAPTRKPHRQGRWG